MYHMLGRSLINIAACVCVRVRHVCTCMCVHVHHVCTCMCVRVHHVWTCMCVHVCVSTCGKERASTSLIACELV